VTEDRIDRYVRGELTSAEARELAQESLDDPELFEELTCSALAKAAVSNRPAAKVVRFPRRPWAFAASAVAAAVILAVYLYRPAPVEMPTLALSATSTRPILLARDLQIGQVRTEVFRSADVDSREPQTTGSVIALEKNLAAIDLGSLDGLAKGSEVEVVRGGRPAGRLIVTTVFRERARAQVASGQVRRTDGVRVPSPAHLGALLQQVDAHSGRGDSARARSTAEKAVEWAQSHNLPADEALERLGSLEYRAGMLEAAEKRYRASDSGVALNNLAVFRALRGDYKGAAESLAQAMSKSPKTESVYARSLNNSGVLAELRGDRAKAAAYYSDALRAFAASSDASEEERRAIEANLARTRGSH
jgi:Flp pilus assembly protein TadD